MILNEGQIDVWTIPVLSKVYTKDYISSLLSDAEQERYQRFHFDKDKNLFLSTHIAVRRIIANYIKQAPAAIEFGYHSKNKPFLKEDPSFEFNLSHSHKLAILGITKTAQLGVDIEYIHREVEYMELAERFFSKQEAMKLKSLEQDDLSKAFFNCWTRKEAFIKATGDGLSFPLDLFEVSLLPWEEPALLATPFDPAEKAHWDLAAFSPREDYLAAIAMRGKMKQINYFTYEETFKAPN